MIIICYCHLEWLCFCFRHNQGDGWVEGAQCTPSIGRSKCYFTEFWVSAWTSKSYLLWKWDFIFTSKPCPYSSCQEQSSYSNSFVWHFWRLMISLNCKSGKLIIGLNWCWIETSERLYYYRLWSLWSVIWKLGLGSFIRNVLCRQYYILSPSKIWRTAPFVWWMRSIRVPLSYHYILPRFVHLKKGLVDSDTSFGVTDMINLIKDIETSCESLDVTYNS